MNVLRFLIVLAFFTLWALVLMAVSALANDQLILQGVNQVNLNRPISVVVTDKMPDNKGCHAYACAVGSYGSGRCIVYVRPDKMEYLYHELQHCSGMTHTKDVD